MFKFMSIAKEVIVNGCKFINHDFVTDDENVALALRSNTLFNVSFTEDCPLYGRLRGTMDDKLRYMREHTDEQASDLTPISGEVRAAAISENLPREAALEAALGILREKDVSDEYKKPIVNAIFEKALLPDVLDEMEFNDLRTLGKAVGMNERSPKKEDLITYIEQWRAEGRVL